MAGVAIKKASEQETNDQQALAKQDERGVSKQESWDPFSLWRTPSEFFSSNPFSAMHRLTEEVDRSFSRFFSREGTEGFWSPVIEVSERDGQLKVHAELPGLKPEDVHVEVVQDQLVIQGERKYEQEEKKKGFYHSERHYGHFYRAIPLPEGANPEQAEARFNNGVLEITLPVPEQKSNHREIPISSQ